METTDVLLVVLLIAASALCGVAIWALREMIATARSVRALSDDTRLRLVPLLDKADITVDAVNAELLRVDAIITQVEEASARVSHASDTISDIVSTPAEIVNDVAVRVRRAWKDRRRSADTAPQPEAESESGDRVDATTSAEPADSRVQDAVVQDNVAEEYWTAPLETDTDEQAPAS